MAFGKLIVGIVIPLWDSIASRLPLPGDIFEPPQSNRVINTGWAPALLLGTAMVARGEIGLLIIQIGLNETPFLSREAFVIAVWGIVLTTAIGLVMVGFLLRKAGALIAEDPRWGVQVRSQRHLDSLEAADPTESSDKNS